MEATERMDEDDCRLMSDQDFHYTPVYFLRCHSKIKEDIADIQTTVWQCAFEPHKDYPEKTTGLIATCGANSVCVINVKTGKVETKYYSRDKKEQFFSVAWSTLTSKTREKISVLGAAGQRCTVHLLHPDKRLCFYQKTFKMDRKTTNLNSLLFHPLSPSTLCGGFSDGQVHVWDIGLPHPPLYEMEMKTLHILSVQRVNTEVFNICFSRHCEMLLAATEDGVCAWSMSSRDLNKPSAEVKTWRFSFPRGNTRDTGTPQVDAVETEAQLVDSVEPLGNGKVLATKCALHGSIYLWDLEVAMRKGDDVQVQPDHILEWSDTDNYFMSLGSHLTSGLLACGDDKGNLWLYSVSDFLCTSQLKHDPSAIIPWPILTDEAAEKYRKVRLDAYDIVINKVSMDYSGKYIVAVTSNNLVCIWRRDS